MNDEEKTLRNLRNMMAMGQPRGLGPASFLISMQNEASNRALRSMGLDPKDYNLGRGTILTKSLKPGAKWEEIGKCESFRVQAVGPNYEAVRAEAEATEERLRALDAQGFISHRRFPDEKTGETDSGPRLAPCDYCNGLGHYDPFVGPTTDCPKCEGTGNVKL